MTRTIIFFADAARRIGSGWARKKRERSVPISDLII
jgi:hypothetical protein